MTVLDRILQHKRVEVEQRQRGASLSSLKDVASSAPAARSLSASLVQPGIRVIAEVKRVSPAKGALRAIVDPAALAERYQAGGAAAVSVLTDTRFFGGNDDDLRAVKARVTIPVLRKDFLIDEYQVWESRAIGSDAVLLIVRALEQSLLVTLLQLANSLGMNTLVEVHDRTELDRALSAGASIVGINNRDLTTLQVCLETTFDLLTAVPPGVVLVSESGIAHPEQVLRLARAGVRSMLVGEALVLANDPIEKLRQLVEAQVAT